MQHSWIFQGNPDVFPIDEYISENTNIVWSVRQKHLADSMSIGDKVFLWRAAGKNKAISGIIAEGILTSPPEMMKDDAASQGKWDEADEVKLRVRIRLHTKCLAPKEVVRRDWLKDDPLASGIRILKVASETNFLLEPSEAQRISLLVKNTGRPWNTEESIAGLWAYAHTYGKTVSRLPGSHVPTVAVAIGRAVTGVYNKVMNFRALDPRDERKGLSAGSTVDENVWNSFFDGELNVTELDKAYLSLWGTSDAAKGTKWTYEDFGEAPDDSIEDLQYFASKVRKGQPKFRKNLLEAYGSKCAITGHGPEAVLEAVHIVPHAISGINKLDNGLLLRADLHSLFDADLLSIDPVSKNVIVHDSLKDTPYQSLNGQTLRLRIDGSQISGEYIKLRYSKSKG